MCGIIGYIGGKDALGILLEGLKKLEYRGYDSSGVALLDDGLQVIKAPGKIVDLEKVLADKAATGKIGIAHTRWATHGEPSEKNAHPHASHSGDFVIVHNGIVENYQELKAQLEADGKIFESDTDSEVIAHLVEKYYDGDLSQAVHNTLQDLAGTYGLIVLHRDTPDELIAARMGSPLIVGLGAEENYIASDVSAILGRTKQVIYLNDGEMARITKDSVDVKNLADELIDIKIENVDWNIEQAEKQGFDTFMLKEINEEPEAIENAIKGRLIEDEGLVHLGGLNMTNDEMRSIERIVILGCGSACYAGMVGEYMIEQYARIPVEVEVASEFRYRNPLITPKTLVLVISQSGETADTLEAMREAQRKGAKALGIINVVGSTIAREADGGVYIHAGPEIAVATTKAFVGQVTVLGLLALLFGRLNGMSISDAKEIATGFTKLPELMRSILKNTHKIEEIAQQYAKYDHFFFLGRGSMYPVAEEGALKLKEISYLHAEAYPMAEMKHGPIALIDDNFPSLVLVPRDHTIKKNLSNMQEIKSRNGKIVVIAEEGDLSVESCADEVLYIPQTHDMLRSILYLMPLHLFSYYLASERGLDVDKPRNLAKSVTVE
ncbi:glutamine--fructose-6-phosphate transaminase (isomerizing) [Patescibacteria group bacterium]